MIHKCPECKSATIEDGEVIGCPHFPKDDLTEYSGKLMSDGTNQEEADRIVIEAIHNANQIGKQVDLF